MDARLLDVDDCVLCVIDVQPGFTDKLDADVAAALVQRVAWVATLARVMAVPIVVTEEEPDRNGTTVTEVVARLDPEQRRHLKPVFGLADDAEIFAGVQSTGRRTAVLVGCETDVCVAHSALGLLDREYRVVVVTDAVGSPGDGHGDGLARMRDAGGILLGTKGLFYEWTRTVDRASVVTDALAAVPVPDGLTL